jgi:hypothetical protein
MLFANKRLWQVNFFSILKIRDPGWTSRIIFPKAEKQFFGLKVRKFFDADLDPGSFRPGTRDGKIPGSEINIPGLQYCFFE